MATGSSRNSTVSHRFIGMKRLTSRKTRGILRPSIETG
ncbi:hypothetical protein LF41_2003 [Lysobacter dokdonensis DS-58]|uniref:Uncharacterized protein n=1 Tax=Lysobacter dokdonensis DS-58 TaxID=1300345 RepID=A0A0A2WCK8_9GAMM|nr:hypothetical protein LF41_2003 [Lysobacter dokdonensis DS-58]